MFRYSTLRSSFFHELPLVNRNEPSTNVAVMFQSGIVTVVGLTKCPRAIPPERLTKSRIVPTCNTDVRPSLLGLKYCPPSATRCQVKVVCPFVQTIRPLSESDVSIVPVIPSNPETVW